jgi:hypothetical protein
VLLLKASFHDDSACILDVNIYKRSDITYPQ